ncbi:hypothetical protein HBB16_00010 [Pseudonocardia sp. MCCB 268]|nr:hypothetical protein [Pseudonocardia cytotoxica]
MTDNAPASSPRSRSRPAAARRVAPDPPGWSSADGPIEVPGRGAVEAIIRWWAHDRDVAAPGRSGWSAMSTGQTTNPHGTATRRDRAGRRGRVGGRGPGVAARSGSGGRCRGATATASGVPWLRRFSRDRVAAAR